ncbi:DUF7563 family protein [Natrinema sp. LN54]|uniref:DUF7563 family protein n=1 Tax=Natrinema sp. LN54 TaxID=3458705 RepID=UPI0040361469
MVSQRSAESKCYHCNAHLTEQFRRVFGDDDGRARRQRRVRRRRSLRHRRSR